MAPPPGEGRAPAEDDTLALLFLCCHAELPPAGRIALTLRAVGGLTTAEIARALLVPEATMAQRITRAVHTLLPADGEVAGLPALMLLTDARRAARTTPDGDLVPLAEQDRTRWDRAAIAEGVTLVSGALTRAPLGPYQLRAALAAVHDEAASDEDTDWVEILALYEVLIRLVPGPAERLGHVVAVAMVHGPRRALALLADLDEDGRLEGHHRLEAVRAHLLEMAGERAAARAAYAKAAGLTLSVPERRYLRFRAAGLAE